MSRILAVSYGGGHAALIAPVVRELLRKGHDVTLIGLTTAHQYFTSNGLGCIGFSELLGQDNRDAYEIGYKLSQGMESGGSVRKEETIAYLGLSFQDMIARLGVEKAWGEYQKKGRQAFLPIGVLERAIDRFQPDLILATNSPRAEQAAIIAASKRSIPSVCIVDLFALQEVQWIGQAGYATKVCVLNQAVKDMFLAHGRKGDEVVVTGNPAFDRLHDIEVVEAGKRMRQERGWNDGKITLLWASQIEPEQHPFAPIKGNPDLPRIIERVLREFVEDNKEFRLVVRYHPSEQVKFVEQRDVLFSPTSENLHVLLHAVDVVIVTASTVGLEASLIGKPVLSVDCSIFTEDAPYSKMEISYGVSRPEELPLAINTILLSRVALQENETDLRGGCPVTSGKSATINVVNVIESLFKH